MQTVNTLGGGGSGVAVGVGATVATSEVGDTRTVLSCGGLEGWGVQEVNTNKTASSDNRKKDAFSVLALSEVVAPSGKLSH